MNRAILVLVVLVLAGLLGGAWYFLSSPAPDPVTSIGPELDGGDPLDDAAPVQALRAPDLAEPEAVEESAVEREALARTEAQPLRGQNIVAAGELEIPLEFAETSVADEALTLYAFFETEDGGRAHAAAEALAESGTARTPDRDAHWASVPVAVGARSVRVPTPEGMQWASCLVRGRFYASEVDRFGADGEPDALAVELGSWITGRVSLPQGWESRGVELEDLELELDENAGRSMFVFSSRGGRTARVADDLTYEFHAVLEESVGVTADIDGLAEFRSDVLILVPGERAELDVELRLGGAVSGRVTDERGAPVADAEVRTGGRMWFMGGEPTETDEDGRYTLYGVKPGTVKVSVSAEGFTDGEHEPFEIADGEGREGVDVVLRRGASVAGRVLWPDGRAAVGARVEVFQEDESNPFRFMASGGNSTLTDAEGRFRITGLNADACRLTATAIVGEDGEPIPIPAEEEEEDEGELEDWPGMSAEELPEGDPWRARAEAVGDQAAAVVLTLEAPGGIAGRVVDDTGAPVTQFMVSASSVQPMRRGWRTSDSTSDFVNSDDGTFELEGLAVGEWRLEVSAEGFGESEEEWTVEVPQAEPIEIVLSRGATLAGVVLDPAGNPVAEAQVSVGEGRRSWGSEDATTGADGAFTFTGLTPQAWTLTAAHPDWAVSEPLAVELEPATITSDLVLTLRVGGTITGEVYTDEGEPQVGARVSWGEGGQRNFNLNDEGPTTDADGRFVLEHVTPGKVMVTAMPSREEMMAGMEDAEDEMSFINVMGAMRTTTVDVAAGEVVHVVLGGTPKQPVTVRGVVKEAGRSVPEARVMVMAEGGSFIEGMKASKTDGDGRFEVVLDRPGAYVFHVSTALFGTEGMGIQFYEDVPAAAAHDVLLDLPMGRIEGRVLGPDGAPAEGVALRLSNEGGAIGLEDLGGSEAKASDEDGEFAFDHLRPGTYALRAGGAVTPLGDGANDLGMQVVGGLALGENEVLDDVVLRLGGAGALEGIVRDETGAPVEGASVFVRDSAGRVLANVSYVTTDAAGRFTYEGLPAGELTVSARTSELTSAEESRVLIEAGATTQVELTLETGSFVVVTAQVDGEPVRARLKMIDEQGRELQSLFAMADMANLFSEGFSSKERRIGPVPPGEYEIFATTPDGKDASRKFTVRPGQEERKVRLRLR